MNILREFLCFYLIYFFSTASNFTNQRQRLVVEQVKVVDEDGSLKVLYPSRTDLQDDNYEVIRNQGQEN